MKSFLSALTRPYLQTAFLFTATSLLLLGIPPSTEAQNTHNHPSIGKIVRLEPALDALLPADTKIEVLCSGFVWSEGPVWMKDTKVSSGYLLFSDVPRNHIIKWQAGHGAEVWLAPSGYTGKTDYGREPGSNGLLFTRDGTLISCEHGDRRIS